MIDSRRRVVTIALVYGIGVALIGGHVGYTMILEHKVWEKRSYTNRWAFRDVPTKRGAIRARRGELLRVDAPTTSLELYYRQFRRRHPCAIAVHAANLMFESSQQDGRFTFRPSELSAAFEICLSQPLSFLRSRTDSKQARDLRFYTSALIGGLTGTSQRRISQRLLELLSSEENIPVVVAMGLDPDALRRVFQDHVDALHRLATMLAPGQVELWEVLRDFEARRRKEVATEYVIRTLLDGLSYEDARRIVKDQEWYAGFRVRPSVKRVDAEVSDHWESVHRLLGYVTREWGEDADELRRAGILDAMMPELERMARAGEEVPEDLRDAVTERLRLTLSNHMANQGRVGRTGIEASVDAVLRGNAGVQWVARGRRKSEVGLWSTFDVTPGNDVRLTVDLRLQNLLEQVVDDVLKDRPPDQNAAIAIVDPTTGDVLAVVSRPRREQDERGRMGLGTAVQWTVNGTIGSLAKPFLLAEHLDAKRHGRPYRDESTFDACEGLKFMPPFGRFRRNRLRCDHVHGSTVHDREASLGVSCNAFFFQLGEGLLRAGVKRAYDRFGLYRGAEPSRAFQPRIHGIPASAYPDPKWKDSHGDIQRRSIGYYVGANVLQMARAYCGLATGRLPELSLVRRPESALRFVDLGLHPDDLLVVRRGMKYCAEQGTARVLGLVDVFAKTGTAEVGQKVDGRTHNNAWLAGFVGVAPAKLAFACVVYNVEHGGYGAKIAGPMFARFLAELRAIPALVKDYL